MDQERNVFYSSEQILSYNDHIEDKFTDLITISPAEPSCSIRVPLENEFSPSVTRLPRNIEFRKRSTTKVKTVGEIRKAFDEHTYKYLPDKLEKIEKYFLKRIRQGGSEDIETICTARNVLNNEDPISRAAWRMITRLNVDNYLCDSQYIKCNKRKIRLNGSKGGQAYILKLYEKSKIVSEESANFEIKPDINKKIGLLQRSLNVAFRPGPLCKKTELDYSYQKKNIGKAVLVDLPHVGLEIKPKLGIPLEPVAYNVIQEKRSPTGAIDEEWANFSVAALAKVDEKNNIRFQTSFQIFNIPFKNNQNRILMRTDYDDKIYFAPCEKTKINSEEKSLLGKFGEVGQDVRDVLNDLIRAVEISTSEESFFSRETHYESSQIVNTSEEKKIKSKKKYANELARLDITVIQMSSDDSLPACSHSFCKLGCICSSLDCGIPFNNHCGKVDCMFDCKCQFQCCTNYGNTYSNLPMPRIINIKNKVTSLLAKEEKKFHQTVVFSKNEPIVLGSKRRLTRTPKRYAEFIHKAQGKEENKLQQIPKVVLLRLAIDNVAPWCLVHQLYRCFCKNKYLESLYTYPLTYNATPTEDMWSEMPVISEPRMTNYKGSPIKKEIIQYHKRLIEPKRLKEFIEPLKASEVVKRPVANEDIIRDFPFMVNCSRTSPIDEFHTKKPDTHFYRERNKRIRQFESEDEGLKEKLERYSGTLDKNLEPFMFKKRKKLGSFTELIDRETAESSNHEQSKERKLFFGSPSDPVSSPILKSAPETSQFGFSQTEHKWIATSLKRGRLSQPKLNCVKGPRFVKWLEKNYINIKSQPGRTINLGEPKNNKVSLYPWPAFQKRYIEKKNVFLVSVKPPFRLYLSLTADIDTLKDCILIDNIMESQLENYPLIISDLLLKVDIEDCFVILNGRTDYWEAVGTVVKKSKIPLSVELKSDLEGDISSEYCSNYSDNSLLTPMFETRLGKGENVFAISKTCKSTQQSNSLTDKLRIDFEVQSNSKIERDTNKSESKCSEIITKKSIVPQLETKNEDDKSAIIESPDPPDVLELTNSSIEQSRWFVLTVESDFSEIRFYNEGFFVKQNNIIKAIALAQHSGETVALPNQSVYELNGTIQPKFGIYAVPLINKNCVLLGPYDLDQVLGVETLCHNGITERKTRGTWIYTNKADNLKVVENPLQFIFQADSPEIVINPCSGYSENDNTITKRQFINLKDFLSKEICANRTHSGDLTPKNKKKPSTAIKKTLIFESKLKPSILQKLKKMSPKNIEQVRPITIKKDNGFYRVAGKLLNKSISILKKPNGSDVVPSPKIVTRVNSLEMLDGSNSFSSIRNVSEKPVADNPKNKVKLGLYILNPVQINDIINQNALESAKTDHTYSLGDFVQQDPLENVNNNTDKSTNGNIELGNTFSDDIAFLKHTLDDTSTTLQSKYAELDQTSKKNIRDKFNSTPPKKKPFCETSQQEADVVCISSDEEYEEAVSGGEIKSSSNGLLCFDETLGGQGNEEAVGREKVTKELESDEGRKLLAHESWLVCRSVESLGFIKSKKKDNLISFQFPGFRESEYFTPATAFDKINQLLARKVFVPPGTQLDWEIVTEKADVKHMEMLNIKYLKAEYVLTKNGLHHSRKFISQHTDEIKQAVALLGQTLLSPEQLANTEQWKLIIMAPNAIQSLKEEESKLFNQKENLKKELKLKKKKYIKLMEDMKKEDVPTEIDIDSFIEGAATVAPHED